MYIYTYMKLLHIYIYFYLNLLHISNITRCINQLLFVKLIENQTYTICII